MVAGLPGLRRRSEARAQRQVALVKGGGGHVAEGPQHVGHVGQRRTEQGLPGRVHAAGQPVGHHPPLVGPGRAAEVQVAMGAHHRVLLGAAAQRLERLPRTPGGRSSSGASRSSTDSTWPAQSATAPAAPAERLVQGEVHASDHGAERTRPRGRSPRRPVRGDPGTVEVPQRRQRECPARGAAREQLLDHAEVAAPATPERDRRGKVVEPDLVQGDQHLDAGMGPVGEPGEDRERTPVLDVEDHRGRRRRVPSTPRPAPHRRW